MLRVRKHLIRIILLVESVESFSQEGLAAHKLWVFIGASRGGVQPLYNPGTLIPRRTDCQKSLVRGTSIYTEWGEL